MSELGAISEEFPRPFAGKMLATVQPHFAAWSSAARTGGFGGNVTVVDKVPPDMLHMVDAHWLVPQKSKNSLTYEKLGVSGPHSCRLFVYTILRDDDPFKVSSHSTLENFLVLLKKCLPFQVPIPALEPPVARHPRLHDRRPRLRLRHRQRHGHLHLLLDQAAEDALEPARRQPRLLRLPDDADHGAADGNQLLQRNLGVWPPLLRDLRDAGVALRLRLYLEHDDDRAGQVQRDREGTQRETAHQEGSHAADTPGVGVFDWVDHRSHVRMEQVTEQMVKKVKF